MVLQFYGSPISTCSKRVATVLHEKKVTFNLHAIDLFAREQKAPEFMANQPFGQVPYIIDGDFVLYESRAICRYIALKYADQGTPLIPSPTDLEKYALFEQAAHTELGSFDPHASRIGNERIINPLVGHAPDEAAAEKALAALEAKLVVYDQILGKQAYLAGDEISLADLFHLSYGTLLKAGGSDIMESKPNVARWWKDISSRPSWIAVKDEVPAGVTEFNII